MKFDTMLQRAKDKGLKVLLFQMNPEPKLFATFGDTEMTKVMGTAIAYAALAFADKTKGEYTKEQVLNSMFEKIMIHASQQLPLLRDPQTEDDMIAHSVREFSKKHLTDVVIDDLMEDDDGDDDDPKKKSGI